MFNVRAVYMSTVANVDSVCVKKFKVVVNSHYCLNKTARKLLLALFIVRWWNMELESITSVINKYL